uniref:Uncharacterized protein n=1 Tax=Chenopodium quinoa TaxID=63459 RepID=A0A803LIE8_CHEQI
MGCTASKLDNEDTVRRCKERRRLIKDAVFARHHLAAAHADYFRSLRVTGDALTDFAAGEPLLVVSPSTPSVLLNHSQNNRIPSIPKTLFSLSSNSSATHLPKPPPPIKTVPYSPVAQPPPPPPECSPTIGSSKVPHILSDSSVKSGNIVEKGRVKRGPKLPHILSDSSVSSSTPKSFAGKFDFPGEMETTYVGVPNYNYASTPSQASSVWNWDNFYPPPSPPDSEFFHPSAKSDTVSSHHVHQGFNHQGQNQFSELRTRSHFGSSSVRSEPVGMAPPLKKVEERSEDGASSSRSWKNNGREVCGSEEMRIVVRHKDLQEIVASLKEYFDKAAAAGDQVSEMLETGRAQLDRSFRQLKKTVYHSSGVLSTLSSTWTSKPPLAVKYRLDTSALEATGDSKSLCSTLERLLAWEKKLYEEVKARESVKIEHEKKLATLQSQEYKGDEVKLDKTKTSIKRLQSLIIVTSQAVNTTSSAIVGLRDSDLIPQLVELCHGMMYMWRSMNQFHEVQNQIVQQVRGLINRIAKGESTSELHRQATRDLESAVSAWHSSFCRLIKFQRDFVRSLHGWFKLSLLPVDHESANMMPEHSDAYPFFDEWKNALDRLPDTVTSEAMKSFVNVVHVISAKQTEEFKIQKRTESISKELEKKSTAVRTLEKKYYNSYSMVGLNFPDGPDNGQVLDARDPLSEKKSELQACQRRVEDEMMKHAKAVEVTRAMTLNNIQTGLPGVFQALTSFSLLFMEGLEAVCTRSYAIK